MKPKKKSQPIEIKNKEGLEYLKTISNSSIDLILTDPIYHIKRNFGMSKHLKTVVKNGNSIKTEDDWVSVLKH